MTSQFRKTKVYRNNSKSIYFKSIKGHVQPLRMHHQNGVSLQCCNISHFTYTFSFKSFLISLVFVSIYRAKEVELSCNTTYILIQCDANIVVHFVIFQKTMNLKGKLLQPNTSYDNG